MLRISAVAVGCPIVLTSPDWTASVIGRPGARALVLSALALLVVLLVLGGRPAVTYGDSPPPPTVGLSGPSQAQMPDGVVLHLTMSSSPDGDVSAAIYDENWNAVRGCIGSCDIRVMTGLLEGGGHPVTKTFHAQSHAPDSQGLGDRRPGGDLCATRLAGLA
jgi:hypothetical protein